MLAQCWLEEHRALRNEIDQQHVSMRYTFIFNITAIGTISSFVLSDIEKHGLLLLIIPIFSSIIGIIFYFHERRMSQLGHYIQSVITPNLRSLTGNSKIIGWESYVREEEEKGGRVMKWPSHGGVSFLTFILPSLLALAFAANNAFVSGYGWCILWCFGLLLTILLIFLTVKERKFWFITQKE